MIYKEKLSSEDLQSILESLLFALGRPISIQELIKTFQKEKLSSKEIKNALFILKKRYEEFAHGIELKEVAGAWQLSTKEENKYYIRRMIKGRAFQLSPPALEVLVIIAYRQPCKKSTIDEIRGVESGHLLKTLMEKDLISFGPKSPDPGHYITYKTTPFFLETFGLKTLKELPSSEDIQELLPSQNDTTEENKDIKSVIKNFTDLKNPIDEEKKIANELEWVSEEIKNIQTKKWNAINKNHNEKEKEN